MPARKARLEFVVKRASLANIVRVSVAYPLWQLEVAKGPYRMTHQLVGDFMRDEIVKSPVSRNESSTKGDKTVTFNRTELSYPCIQASTAAHFGRVIEFRR
jgi:hypothetical protein